MTPPGTVHATAILLGETGILIRGASGSGKSALALDLLSSDPAGARLVADDRVVLVATAGRLLADAPPRLAGMIELRGRGILHFPHIAPVVVRLVVDLVPAGDCPRMPEDEDLRVAVEGVSLPRLFAPAENPRAASRVRTALCDIFGQVG